MNAPCFKPVPHDLSPDVQLWRVDLDAYARAAALYGQGAQRRLASRHALRHLLAAVLHRPPESLVITPDDFGKPRLVHADAPHFNLSHSAHECLIGVSQERPIGVDIEVVHEVVDAGPLTRAHFTDGEQAEWSRADECLRDRTFLACWTRKEACAKALGVGLRAQAASIEVGCGPQARVVAIPLGTSRCEVTLSSLRMLGESVAAVAVAAPEAVTLAQRFFRPGPPSDTLPPSLRVRPVPPS
jgi:4'-phosphopantetheinyl transferase